MVRMGTWVGTWCAVVASAGLLTAAAHAAPGDLDTTFGTQGVTQTHFNASAYGEAAALDSNDRILVAGTEVGYGIAVVRYLSDGRIDNQTNDPGGHYNGDGVATLAINSGNSHHSYVTRDVVIDSSGRALVLGGAYSQATSRDVVIVARFKANGDTDTSFGGGDGWASVRFADAATSSYPGGIGLQADGRIIVGGRIGYSFAAKRLAVDGTEDGTFGSGGAAILASGGDFFSVTDVAVDNNDRFVLGGFISTMSHARFALARFTAGGALDGTFGSGGLAQSYFPECESQVSALALAPGGGYVATGYACPTSRVGVARYTSSGLLDSSFSGDGMQTSAAAGFPTLAPEDVLVEATGRVTVAGRATTGGGQHQYLLARYGADGAPDAGFAGGGLTTRDVSGGYGAGLVMQSTGRLVVAGRKPAATGGGSDIAVVGFRGGDPDPEPTFEPKPPTQYQTVEEPPKPPMKWRIQGIEITQGTQDPGVHESDQASGYPTVGYKGAKFVKGGRTMARVFINAAVPVKVTLRGFNAAGQEHPGSPLATTAPWAPVDLSNTAPSIKQTTHDGGYIFELPDAWVRGRLRLEAQAQGVSESCQHPGCNPSILQGITFTPVRPIKIRLVELVNGDAPPPEPQRALQRALQLVPQDTARPIEIPLTYAGQLDVGSVKAGTTECELWYWCRFRDRTDSNTATLEALQDWDEANPPRDRKDIDVTIGISADPNIGISNGATVFPWHGQFQWCSIGGAGSAFTCTRPVIAVSEAELEPRTKGRPFTGIDHEIFHALGRPHASKSCGGGGGGLELAGEDWPPDQAGMLQGIGFDFGWPMPGTGLTTKAFLPYLGLVTILDNHMPLYRIVPEHENVAYNAHKDVGGTTKNFDLMSYCGAPGNGDQHSWIGPHNWNGAVDILSTGSAARRSKTRAIADDAGPGDPGSIPAAGYTDAGSGPRMQVNAVQVGDSVRITSMEEVVGRTAEMADPGAVPHVVFAGAGGKPISDTPMEAIRTHVDEPGATPVTMLRALTPVPPAGMRSVAIEEDGKPVATRTRSKHSPRVRIVSPKRGRIAQGKDVTVRWSATDRDGDSLLATVDFAADGRNYRTVWSGPDRGRATLPSTMFAPGRRARVRITADDGFNKGTVRSRPLRVAARPPVVVITGIPAKRRVLAGQSVTLHASATQTGGVVVAPSAMSWFVGKKRVARGPEVTVKAPAKGKLTVRFVARPAKGSPAATRRVVLTVVKPQA